MPKNVCGSGDFYQGKLVISLGRIELDYPGDCDEDHVRGRPIREDHFAPVKVKRSVVLKDFPGCGLRNTPIVL